MFVEPEKFDKKYFIDKRVYIDISLIEGAGYGCFASEDIPARTVIESSPVILYSADTMNYLNKIHSGVRHILNDYAFKWPDGLAAMSMGWGGIYNHSFDPNCQWRFRTEEKDGFNALFFRTVKDIKAGEEIYVRYVPDYDMLWFLDDSQDPLQKTNRQVQRQIKNQSNSNFGFLEWGDLTVSKKERSSYEETIGNFKLKVQANEDE